MFVKYNWTEMFKTMGESKMAVKFPKEPNTGLIQWYQTYFLFNR